MKKQTKSPKVAATLTVFGPGKMTKKGRSYIVAWLRQGAKDLERNGHLYTNGRFRARYLYR